MPPPIGPWSDRNVTASYPLNSWVTLLSFASITPSWFTSHLVPLHSYTPLVASSFAHRSLFSKKSAFCALYSIQLLASRICRSWLPSWSQLNPIELALFTIRLLLTVHFWFISHSVAFLKYILLISISLEQIISFSCYLTFRIRFSLRKIFTLRRLFALRGFWLSSSSFLIAPIHISSCSASLTHSDVILFWSSCSLVRPYAALTLFHFHSAVSGLISQFSRIVT